MYNTYIHKWKFYTRLNNSDSLSPSEAEVANFLAHMFDQGASYSSVNAARSALSTVIPSTNKATIGSSREVCRLVKGVFEARPALPKHTNTWSVDSVLDYVFFAGNSRSHTKTVDPSNSDASCTTDRTKGSRPASVQNRRHPYAPQQMCYCVLQ